MKAILLLAIMTVGLLYAHDVYTEKGVTYYHFIGSDKTELPINIPAETKDTSVIHSPTEQTSPSASGGKLEYGFDGPPSECKKFMKVTEENAIDEYESGNADAGIE